VYAPINLSQLAEVSGDNIGPEELRDAGMVRKKAGLIKILGNGEIDRSVTVKAHAFSRSAKEKIEAAGGSTEILER
jgi:large subunit ribosomal protein L15